MIIALGMAITATCSAYALAQRAPSASGTGKAPAPAAAPTCPAGATNCPKAGTTAPARGEGAGDHRHGPMMGGPKKQHGMHGDCMQGDGMHGDCMHGKGMDSGECPMMGLAGTAQLRVENTKDGVLLRWSAKDPSKVQEVQRLAAELAKHFEASATKPAAHGGHTHQP
jgi:hypothetical protein